MAKRPAHSRRALTSPARRPAKSRPARARARLKLSEAMRAVGLDESRLAGELDRLLRRLRKPKNEKLFLESLKECNKLLEAYPSQRPGAANAAPCKIIFDVPRPARERHGSGSEGKTPEEDPESDS